MKYSKRRLRGKIHSKNFQIDKRRLYSECRRKKGYTTSAAANRMIKHQLRHYGIKCNYYQCTYCGKYHLTRKWVGDKFKG